MPAGDRTRFLRIGAVAREVGLSPDTLRHYERVGVLPLPERSANGYREYGGAALARIGLVQRALACGFTLAELAAVLRLRDQGAPPCRRVRALAAGKLAKMDHEIARLTERRDALRATLRDWDHRLSRTPRGRPARLLDHIIESRSLSRIRRSAPLGRMNARLG
jgi:DNA-binding transcriptional MerR regulator